MGHIMQQQVLKYKDLIMLEMNQESKTQIPSYLSQPKANLVTENLLNSTYFTNYHEKHQGHSNTYKIKYIIEKMKAFNFMAFE